MLLRLYDSFLTSRRIAGFGSVNISDVLTIFASKSYLHGQRKALRSS